MVTQKPRPERSLAIALENVTPDAIEGLVRNTAAQAPRVTASGRGAVAEQILQIAFERGVKVRTDADLAEILAAVEVESEIPLAALAGVAEILRYLYQTDRKPAGGHRVEGKQAGAAAGHKTYEEK
ncbi:EscU/YscU/HrcU family type III secretion system export apparatus switch protein [Pelagibius marinus]|uniref:EscU/YscU/HrcU family type III secretion system export apparatus switch protein n=1 Tax=Pelagibius marinus TaxID=2762760 RepID=UPI00187297DF|nr:EscU/YscU/HrcU family type III secretion system export apparatus switch protein [Pelagibius marinus]